MAASPVALPRPLRTPLFFVAAFGALVVLAQSLLYAGDTTGEWFAPMNWLSGPLWYFVTVVDFLGEPVGAVLVLAVLILACWFAGRRRTAVLVPVATAVSVGATTLLKPIVDREIHGGYLAFPSGHTAYATTLALVLGMALVDRLHLGRASALAALLGLAVLAAAVMGGSEVALSAHYPTDTLGGFCTGLVVAPLSAWVVDLCWTRFGSAGNETT